MSPASVCRVTDIYGNAESAGVVPVLRVDEVGCGVNNVHLCMYEYILCTGSMLAVHARSRCAA